MRGKTLRPLRVTSNSAACKRPGFKWGPRERSDSGTSLFWSILFLNDLRARPRAHYCFTWIRRIPGSLGRVGGPVYLAAVLFLAV